MQFGFCPSEMKLKKKMCFLFLLVHVCVLQKVTYSVYPAKKKNLFFFSLLSSVYLSKLLCQSKYLTYFFFLFVFRLCLHKTIVCLIILQPMTESKKLNSEKQF